MLGFFPRISGQIGLTQMITIEIKVPNRMVGLGMAHEIRCTLGVNFILPLSVIGRGGEMINKLQSESGARIQVAPGKSCWEYHSFCLGTLKPLLPTVW